MQILFENGAGARRTGAPPRPGFGQLDFDRLPIPGTLAKSWYLGAAGALTDAAPAATGADSFNWNTSARPATDFTGDTSSGGLWTATPAYNWTPNPAGTALTLHDRAAHAADTASSAAARCTRGSRPRPPTSTSR